MRNEWTPEDQAEAERQAPGYVFSDDDDEAGLVPAIPAATLVVLREGHAGMEALFVQRSARMSFAAGAAVFPGGRIDEGDRQLASIIAPHLDRHDAAARVAAVRETIEETGVAIGIEAAAHDIARWREALHAGASLGEVLPEGGRELDLTALTPFTRWRPNFNHSRVFDARFYIATGRSDQEAIADRVESTDAFWLGAPQLLHRAAEGGASLIFPTRRVLERVAQWTDARSAKTDASRFAPKRVTPWIAHVRGESRLCIRGDCGYPITQEIASRTDRG